MSISIRIRPPTPARKGRRARYHGQSAAAWHRPRTHAARHDRWQRCDILPMARRPFAWATHRTPFSRRVLANHTGLSRSAMSQCQYNEVGMVVAEDAQVPAQCAPNFGGYRSSVFGTRSCPQHFFGVPTRCFAGRTRFGMEIGPGAVKQVSMLEAGGDVRFCRTCRQRILSN